MKDKIKIWENSVQINAIRDYYKKTCENLNEVLEAFHKVQTEHRIETETEALKFGAEPVNYLIELSGIKPTTIKDNKRPVLGLAEFRAAIQKIALDSAKNRFRIGIHLKTSGYKINAENSKLIQWIPELRQFGLNSLELEKLYLPYQRFVTTPEQIQKVKQWETLVDLLNQHPQPINPDRRAEIATLLGLSYYDGYSIDYKQLANTICHENY